MRLHFRRAVGGEQIQHIAGVLLLDRKNRLEHRARGRIIVAEEADQFPIMVDGDPLGYEILLDHFDQIGAGGIFGRRPGRQARRVEIGYAAS